MGMHPYSLKFRNRKIENTYKRLVLKSNLWYLRVIFYLLLAIFGGYTIGEALTTSREDSDRRVVGFVRLGFIVIFLFSGLLFFTRFIEANYERIAFAVSNELMTALLISSNRS